MSGNGPCERQEYTQRAKHGGAIGGRRASVNKRYYTLLRLFCWYWSGMPLEHVDELCALVCGHGLVLSDNIFAARGLGWTPNVFMNAAIFPNFCDVSIATTISRVDLSAVSLTRNRCRIRRATVLRCPNQVLCSFACCDKSIERRYGSWRGLTCTIRDGASMRSVTVVFLRLMLNVPGPCVDVCAVRSSTQTFGAVVRAENDDWPIDLYIDFPIRWTLMTKLLG
jgi:hypothetical protein